MNFDIKLYECLASTNVEARHLALNSTLSREVTEGKVIVCQSQTEGRGQAGNSWESEAGKNLTFSVVLQPKFAPENLFMITQAMSLGIVQALALLGVKAKIKWPNDIYVNNRKIAGILTEHSFMGNNLSFSVIGVGLNVNQLKFVSNAPNPTSLIIETGNIINKQTLLQSILNSFVPHYTNLQNKIYDIVKAHYMSSLYRSDDFYNYQTPQGEAFKAKISDVLHSGEIILEDELGAQKKYLFKEVIAV